MLVALKSLMPNCLFNVIGFGSMFKTVFPSSQTYSEVRMGHIWDRRMVGDREQRQGEKRRGNSEVPDPERIQVTSRGRN